MTPWSKEEMLQEVKSRSIILSGRRVIDAEVLSEVFADPRFPKECEELMLLILNEAKRIKQEHEEKNKPD